MPALAPDTIVDGRYRLLQRLGSGGMADVWLAEDPHLQRHVALARVRPDLAKAGTRVHLEFTVDHHYQQVAAHVARLPLYNPERKTA